MKKRRSKIICLLITIIVIAIFLEIGILYNVNNKNTEKTSKVLLKQVINIIDKNQKNEEDMIKSLKEDYIVRAKAVAYIIDARPSAEKDQKELQKIVKLMSIDEIHLFDKTGKIYGGSVPKYYGYSFNSGKQIAYFKPMLKNKKLTMCQDVTPNTSDKKKMMYAITWNDTGDKMIQVGIEPKRLLEEVKQNEVHTVISNMPVYKGIKIYVADKKSGKIYGSTQKSKVGKTLDAIGISQKNRKENKIYTDMIHVDGKKSKCTLKMTDKYVIAITFEIASDNATNLTAILIVAIYLSIAAGVILVVTGRLFKVRQAQKEQSEILSSISEISNTDNLTGCFNRRAYEQDIENLSLNQQFIYVSMDVNGLKIVNDSMGHMAGDELLCGAAACMKQCFDQYGKVYRIGGDEFVAILLVGREQFAWIKMEFDRIIHAWEGERLESISVSSGYVSSKEKDWTSINEIAHIADIRMYEEKAMYYKKNGVDRRGQPEAYVALYKLYSKILKVNLEKDSYEILNCRDEKSQQQRDSGKLSQWLNDFENLEDIHKDDQTEYKEKMRLEYLRNYFEGDQRSLSISYRRKEQEEYKRISLEIVAREEELRKQSEYFLYVKG